MTRRRAYPRWLVRALFIFAAAMTVLAAVASREHHSVEGARDRALSRLVAVNARDLAASDPALAMQLALASWGTAHTVEARSTLLDLAAAELPTRLLGRPGQSQLALADDGHRLAIAYQPGDKVQVYALRYAQLTLLATVPAAAPARNVDALALSPSGRLLATGDSGGEVRLWSLTSPAHPRRLAILHAGSGAVHGLGFSPGGGALAAADADGSVQRWSLADSAHPALAPALTAPGRPALEAVGYNPDGASLAAVGRNGTLVVWRAHGSSRPLTALASGGPTLTTVGYSPGARTLAVGARDGSTELWALATDGRPVLRTATLAGAGSVSALAFSRDGRFLAVGASDRTVRIWSMADGHQLTSLPQPGGITGLAFSDGDLRLLSSDTSGTTLLWQFPPPSTHRFSSAVTALSYSTTQPRLTVSTRAGGSDQWDIVDEWRPAPVGSWYAARPSAAPADAYWIKAATTTTSTPTTPSGAPVNPHAGDRALRRTLAATRVLSSMLSPDGQLFAAAGSDHLVWLWDVSSPRAPKLIAKLSGFKRWVTAVIFSGNSQTLFAAGADHTVRIWDVSTPDKPQQLPDSPLRGPSSAITQLALSPDSRTLAAATAEGHVWLWAVRTPTKAGLSATLTAAPGAITALTFSPDENVLVAASHHRLSFWHYRPYQAVNRICALAGTPITSGEWGRYVPGAAYKPPCARWTPPVPPTATTPASP